MSDISPDPLSTMYRSIIYKDYCLRIGGGRGGVISWCKSLLTAGARGRVDRSPLYRRRRHTKTNNPWLSHFHTNWINLTSTCMFLDGGRKQPDYLETTHTDEGRTCKLSTSCTSNCPTFLLWGTTEPIYTSLVCVTSCWSLFVVSSICCAPKILLCDTEPFSR